MIYTHMSGATQIESPTDCMTTRPDDNDMVSIPIRNVTVLTMPILMLESGTDLDNDGYSSCDNDCNDTDPIHIQMPLKKNLVFCMTDRMKMVLEQRSRRRNQCWNRLQRC